MNTKINLRRIAAGLTLGLLVFGCVSLIASGQVPYVAASARGYLHARIDLLLGKRELQIYRANPAARRITRLGLPTSEHYPSCLPGSVCGTFHRSYDAEVRRSIRRDFGYDIFSELEQPSAKDISIVIQHR